MDATCKLRAKTVTQDSLGFPIASETARETFCSAGSISRAEFFNAGKAGLSPDFVFKVNAIEYNGEDELEYDGARYGIYRTYRGDADIMELYAEYKSGVTDIDHTEPSEEVTDVNNN